MKKRLSVCTALIWLAGIAAASAADLKITDSRGRDVLVSGAAIDYGGMMSDKEPDGIRVLQGDGVVMVKWADVTSLKVTRRDESVKPVRIEIEIVLRSGKTVAAEFFRQGVMKLSGRTELGEYAIDLDKIRAIVPVR